MQPTWRIPGVGVMHPCVDRVVIVSTASVGYLKKFLPLPTLEKAFHSFDIRTYDGPDWRLQSRIVAVGAGNELAWRLLKTHEHTLGRYWITLVELAFDVRNCFVEDVQPRLLALTARLHRGAAMIEPRVIEHDDVFVVRDDLFPGGTKARFLPSLFDGVSEVVYASPAEGGAQTALATVAAQLGKRATIFVAQRAQLHPRTLMAKRLGAQIVPVSPGYLNVVQARAIKYSHQTGAVLAPFGFDIPGAAQAIAQAALSIGIQPDEVWCAGGSGVLARGLAQAWPNASPHVVQVGRPLRAKGVAGATIHVYPKPFKWATKNGPPFPSDPHYDAKAWELCLAHKGSSGVLFWNVTGPAEP